MTAPIEAPRIWRSGMARLDLDAITFMVRHDAPDPDKPHAVQIVLSGLMQPIIVILATSELHSLYDAFERRRCGWRGPEAVDTPDGN